MTSDRREFLCRAGLSLLALPLLVRTGPALAETSASGEAGMATDAFVSAGSAALGGSFAVDPQWEAASQELIRSFVMPCHFGLEEARGILRQDSRLVNARMYSTDEAPIEAASHMGRADIAEFLLGHGAPYTVHCSVMLGAIEAAKSFFERDALQAVRPGAHGIPMMAHAAISGNIAMAELLEQHGGAQDYDPALAQAAGHGHLAMCEWLLGRGANVNFVANSKSALDWAERNEDNAAVATLLKSHGAKYAAELE